MKMYLGATCMKRMTKEQTLALTSMTMVVIDTRGLRYYAGIHLRVPWYHGTWYIRIKIISQSMVSALILVSRCSYALSYSTILAVLE